MSKDQHFFDVVEKVRPILAKIKDQKVSISKTKEGFELTAKLPSKFIPKIGVQLFQFVTDHIHINYDTINEIITFRYTRIPNHVADKPIPKAGDSNGQEFSPSNN